MVAQGYAEYETEQSTTSTSLVDACTLTFTADAADYIIMVTCETGGSSISSIPNIVLDVDGTGYMNHFRKMRNTGDRISVGCIKKVTFTAASHTIKIQYASNSTYTAYIRNIHIYAWKPTDAMQYNETEAEQAISSTELTEATLTFTPASQQDYLIMASWEDRTTAITRYNIGRLKVDTVEKNLVYSTDNDTTNDYVSHVIAKVENLTAASHTIIVTLQRSGSGTGYARKIRLVCIPLGNETVFQSSDETETNTTSTTYVDKLSYSPTISPAGDYITIVSTEHKLASTTIQRYNNMLIDSTQYNETIWVSVVTTDYYTFLGLKKLNFTNASHTFKTQYMIASGATATYMKMARIIIIKVPGTGVTNYKTIAATETAVASIGKSHIFVKALAATETAVLTLRRTIKKPIVATETAVTSIRRKVSKFISIQEVSVSSIRRKISKTLSKAEVSVATITKARLYVKLISVIEFGVAVLTYKNVIGKVLSAVSGSSASIRRKVGKQVIATEVSVGTVRRKVSKFISGQAGSVSSIRRTISKFISIQEVSVASIRRTIGKTISAIEVSIASLSTGSLLPLILLRLKNLKALLLSLLNSDIPARVEEYRDTSLKFGGVSDYVNCGNGTSLDLTSGVSLCAWVKPNAASFYGYTKQAEGTQQIGTVVSDMGATVVKATPAGGSGNVSSYVITPPAGVYFFNEWMRVSATNANRVVRITITDTVTSIVLLDFSRNANQYQTGAYGHSSFLPVTTAGNPLQVNIWYDSTSGVDMYLDNSQWGSRKAIVGKASQTSQAYRLFGSATGYRATLLNSLNVSVNLNGTINARIGQWDFVVFTYDGTTMKLYVNGASAGSIAQSNGIKSITENVYIGGKSSGFGNPDYFNGLIDEVRIYNRDLLLSEIQDLMKGIRIASGLVGEWQFNEGSGTQAIDTSGNNNTGTIYGATYDSGAGAVLELTLRNDDVVGLSEQNQDTLRLKLDNQHSLSLTLKNIGG